MELLSPTLKNKKNSPRENSFYFRKWKFLIFSWNKAFLIFWKKESPKKLLIFQETELSYISENGNPKKTSYISGSKGSFKRYVTPEAGGRVVNFIMNRYGNQGGGEGVSVMPLRNVDKCFYIANFTIKLTYRKLFFVLFNLKSPGIPVKIILVTLLRPNYLNYHEFLRKLR